MSNHKTVQPRNDHVDFIYQKPTDDGKFKVSAIIQDRRFFTTLGYNLNDVLTPGMTITVRLSVKGLTMFLS
jgi:hypothetical protein